MHDVILTRYAVDTAGYFFACIAFHYASCCNEYEAKVISFCKLVSEESCASCLGGGSRGGEDLLATFCWEGVCVEEWHRSNLSRLERRVYKIITRTEVAQREAAMVKCQCVPRS